jgi:O-antigen chain-terminating methyltransferase
MPEKSSSGPEPLVDVDKLVRDLRDRVYWERAAGRYNDDVSSLALEAVAVGSPRQGTESGAPPAAPVPQIVYRPQLGYSSRPIVGAVLTAFKRVLYRVFFYPLDDLARQTNDAVQHAVQQFHERGQRTEHALEIETAARDASHQALVGRIDTLVNQLELADRMIAQREGEAREAVARDVQSLAVRLAELEAAQERLQLSSRLARLERLTRTAPQPSPPRGRAPAQNHAPAPRPPSFDYMTFENRFRPEQTVRDRHSEYLEVLRKSKRVVDLGCGRGELLELLGEAGVSAYGVELDPDNVAVCREKGLEMVEGDAISHLEGLDEASLDGIVASHLIEHLTPDVLWRLIVAAAEKLEDGGILILETPNPESLLAGSINFHRDPTHVRPVHPETLSFLAESAGFRQVELRRLAPVPAEVRLPQRSSDGGDLSEHVDKVVEQLNELIYGYQDYALIARL